nr:hypothetical protein Itr_chr03CG06990 [Ipomoea trifida]
MRANTCRAMCLPRDPHGVSSRRRYVFRGIFYKYRLTRVPFIRYLAITIRASRSLCDYGPQLVARISSHFRFSIRRSEFPFYPLLFSSSVYFVFSRLSGLSGGCEVGATELNNHPRPIGSKEMSDSDSQNISQDYEGEFPVASPSGSRTRSTEQRADGSSMRSEAPVQVDNFEGDEAESRLQEHGPSAEVLPYGRGKSPRTIVEALSA